MATVATAAPTLAATKARAARGGRAGEWRNALFVAPYLAVFVVMLVVPLIWGMWLSTTKSDLFGFEGWVGFANFVRLIQDPIFLQTVWNTFYFVLLTVPALTLAGLGLALVLNRPERWAAVLRAIFFASTVLSVTVVTLVWRLVFLPDGGLLGVTAEALGETPIAFLNDEDLAMPAIAITTIWWCIGLPMVLFLAALQQVPRELYEAAALDNASRRTTLMRITLPAIRRTFFLVIIIEVILQFQLFGQPQLMTLGGPNNATRPIVLFIYETGWRQWELGYAAAAAQVLFAMILIAAMIQYRISARREGA
jgi:multiple sugar transport system permease protein